MDLPSAGRVDDTCPVSPIRIPTWPIPPDPCPLQTRSTPTLPLSPGRTTSGRTHQTRPRLPWAKTNARGSLLILLLPPTIACSCRQSILSKIIIISPTLVALRFPPSTPTIPPGSPNPIPQATASPLITALLTTILPISIPTSFPPIKRTSFVRG